MRHLAGFVLLRATVEFLAQVVDARARGGEVLITHGKEEVSPTEAAAMLRMSRPQVRKLMERGDLPYRMVGTHHRILVDDVTVYLSTERERQRAVRKKYAALQNELGLA